MSPIILHLTSLSAKIALLGGLAWMQLYLLRRAPAISRSRLCSLAVIAIALLAAGEFIVAPGWQVRTPVFYFTATSTSHAAVRFSPGSWIGVIWMAGALIMLTRVAAGRVALTILRRQSTFVEQISGVDVRIADIETPILTGLLRPAILVPSSAGDWTEEQRRMVLTHELTHFRQGDCWSNLLAQVVRTACWFHPVVWLLASRMSREQELACDEAVIESGHSCHDYAAFLLDSARDLNASHLFACAMAGSGARSLKLRFANLLDASPRRALGRRLAVSMALCAALAVGLAMVRPVWSQNEKASQKEKASENEKEVYRVGGDVLPPTVLTKVDPEYTQHARAAKISGPVYLTMVISPEGKAENIEVTSGLDPGLDLNAVDAISQWTFQPATKEGKAVATVAHVQVNYRLL